MDNGYVIIDDDTTMNEIKLKRTKEKFISFIKNQVDEMPSEIAEKIIKDQLTLVNNDIDKIEYIISNNSYVEDETKMNYEILKSEKRYLINKLGEIHAINNIYNNFVSNYVLDIDTFEYMRKEIK